MSADDSRAVPDINARVSALLDGLEGLDAKYPGHVRGLLGPSLCDRLLDALAGARPAAEPDARYHVPSPPPGSKHWRDGWRNGYEQCGIDRACEAEELARDVPAGRDLTAQDVEHAIGVGPDRVAQSAPDHLNRVARGGRR